MFRTPLGAAFAAAVIAVSIVDAPSLRAGEDPPAEPADPARLVALLGDDGLAQLDQVGHQARLVVVGLPEPGLGQGDQVGAGQAGPVDGGEDLGQRGPGRHARQSLGQRLAYSHAFHSSRQVRRLPPSVQDF